MVSKNRIEDEFTNHHHYTINLDYEFIYNGSIDNIIFDLLRPR